MKFTELIPRLMIRLSALPGLGFLDSYVTSTRAMKTRFGQRKGDYEAYISAAGGAGGELGDAFGRSKKKRSDEDEKEEEESSSGDDYYWDDDDTVYSDSFDNPDDDYPASDENNTYYDDDYRSD